MKCMPDFMNSTWYVDGHFLAILRVLLVSARRIPGFKSVHKVNKKSSIGKNTPSIVIRLERITEHQLDESRGKLAQILGISKVNCHCSPTNNGNPCS